MEFINNAKPASLLDCIIKLRVLADPIIGMEAGDRDDDVVSVRQVLAFLEGTIGGGHEHRSRSPGPVPPLSRCSPAATAAADSADRRLPRPILARLPAVVDQQRLHLASAVVATGLR